MFELPGDFPLTAYLGQRIEQVFEGSHFVDLNLAVPGAKGGLVRFEGPVVLRIPGEPERRIANDEIVIGNTIFQPLVGAVVEAVDRISEVSCRFAFSNGWSLDLIGEKELESYHLWVAGTSCDV
jgi:hypothetical protein